METLFLLLGTGQNVLQNLDQREYKKTPYYLANDKTKRTVESPFVGEAIVKLHPNRFSQIHIFGTNSSMWETLYMYVIDKINDPADTQTAYKYFPKIWKAISEKSLDQNPELLQDISDKVSKYFGTTTYCHIIEVGENENQLWNVFDNILHLKLPEKTLVSFDITHGLRYQPFFFIFSLFYLNLVSDSRVKFGSIFYGALELRNEERHKGIAPIFEYNVFSELHNWITATEVFHRYKDPEQFVNLLKNNPDTNQLSEIISNYSFAFNSNNYSDIIKYSKLLVEEIDELEKVPDLPIALKFVLPKIKELPKEINSAENKAQKLLLISRILLKQHNYSSSILAMYEAVVETYREQKKIEDQFEANTYFTKDLNTFKSNIIKNKISNFYKNINDLKNLRNQVAHLNQTDSNALNKEKILLLINYFSGNLEKVKFS